MCIRDPINKTCRKNGKDLSNRSPNIKLWNHTKKTHFPVFAKNFRRPCMKLKNFFGQFPTPWTLRVSGMGGYTSECEKKSKSLHPTVTYFPLRSEGSTARIGRSERGLRRERRKGLDEGGKLGGSTRCGSVMRLRDEVAWSRRGHQLWRMRSTCS